jgi:hypothetical protein
MTSMLHSAQSSQADADDTEVILVSRVRDWLRK